MNQLGKRGLFVTGSDTGVGKTAVACGLARALRRRGVSLRVRKPVESGCVNGVPADAVALNAAAGDPDPIDLVCRYPLPEALSPDLAADIAGVDIALESLCQQCHAPSGELLMVEGAGGFYSPLTYDGLNADLAECLQLPLLLVVADRLGCINHTLLTVEALFARGLSLLAVALNRATAEPVEAFGNAENLRARLTTPLILIPRMEAVAPFDAACDRLAELVVEKGPSIEQSVRPSRTEQVTIN